MRPIARGRIYSLIASARRHHLEPWAYLRDVLARIGSTPVSQLDRFLPDRWKREADAAASLPSQL